MAEKHGIFIRSDKDAVLIIRGCEELLKSINSDSSCIKSLKAEDNPRGFTISFKDNSPIPTFLRKRYLPLTEEMATIHTLTTKLTVHDIYPDSEEYLMNELRSKLAKLGNILSITNIPAVEEFPSIQSGDWLVELSTPEIFDMDIFNSNGLPNGMNIQISSQSEPSMKRVTFFCSLCKNREHPRELCQTLDDSLTNQYKRFVGSEDEPTDNPFTTRFFPNFEIPDKFRLNSSTPISKSTKQKHRIEAIASGLEKKKTQTKSNLLNYYPRTSTELKHEPEEESYASSHVSASSKRPLEESEGGMSSKKFRLGSILPNRSSNDQDRPEDYSTAISTTGRDTPEVLYDSAMDTPEKTNDSDNFESKVFNYHEDSNIQNLPTSSQSENIYNCNASSSAVQQESDYSDSNDNSKPMKGTRKKPIYAPVVLPDRIKQIVSERGVREGELSISQLEAFFNHVKKKMSPAKIARQFTNDVQCLHDQLKAIVQQFYMTPKAGSGEDSRFMKWLQGMLERFDSVPSKRKKIKSEH